MAKADIKRVVIALLVGALKVVWVSAMVIIPLLGMWLSSSLAAYRNSSLWASLAVGLLLFPIAPLAWEWLYTWRRRRSGTEREQILTRLDRLVLRTLCLNLAFITIVVWSAPATAFRALATRGDWMLEGRTGAASETARSALFAIADGLEGLYGRVEDNHFGSSDAPPDLPNPDDGSRGDDGGKGDGGEGDGDPTRLPAPPDGDPDAPPTLAVGDTTYPAPSTPHPVVASLGDVKTYAEAARAIGAQVSEPFEQVKALHDFVAARLTYDDATFEAYQAGRFDDWPSQQPADVFTSRIAVCEGYARLLAAMGKEIGVEIAYIVGRGGRDGDEVDGVGHAWNAAKIEGRWYLIDATWNDGEDDYGTTYLFTPPALFRLDHLPEDDRWQLHHEVLSLADFMRQPMISPALVLLGLEMKSPDRAQITVEDRAEVVLANPRGAHLIASLTRHGGDKRDCVVAPAGDGASRESRITCEIPASGRYTLEIYGRAKTEGRQGKYPQIAKVLVNSK